MPGGVPVLAPVVSDTIGISETAERERSAEGESQRAETKEIGSEREIKRHRQQEDHISRQETRGNRGIQKERDI